MQRMFLHRGHTAYDVVYTHTYKEKEGHDKEVEEVDSLDIRSAEFRRCSV